jgi:oxygen-independent coproporphyrinogen-3 oxidase
VDQVARQGEHKRESFDREIEALQPFVAEGFARIDGCRVKVKESGRPYLRLIAATFDAYLPDSHARHSVAV